MSKLIADFALMTLGNKVIALLLLFQFSLFFIVPFIEPMNVRKLEKQRKQHAAAGLPSTLSS